VPRVAAGSIDLDVDLDPFDRMVLTADGTVTTLLEACTGEPIVTAPIRQSGPAPLDVLRTGTGCWWDPDVRLLGLAPDEPLIARRVKLHGARSGLAYVLAEAIVAHDRLPERIAHRLQRAGASLGRLLTAGRLEARRELVLLSTVRAGRAGSHLDAAPDTTLARRTYTIVAGDRSVAAVTEWLVPHRLAAAAARPR
jgi:chorismate-pyruvate lyase